MDISMMNGEGGPFMSGTWYNPNTGDSFTVRDTFFEDNNLIVMTTDGRRLNYDIISRYVKSDKPIPKQQPVVKQEQPKPVVPKEIQDMIAEDPGINFGNPKDVVPAYPQSVAVTAVHEDINGVMYEIEDEDTLLVRRIMKRASVPEVNCNVVWKNYPSKQLEMLEMMGVEPEKIADYVMKDFDLETIRAQIKKSIIEYIEKPEVAKTIEALYVETPVIPAIPSGPLSPFMPCSGEPKIITVTNTEQRKDPLEVINTAFNTRTNELKDSEQNANFTTKEYPAKLSKRVNKQQTKKTTTKK